MIARTIPRRQHLSHALSLLEGFESPDPSLEQVPTPPESASEILWEALARGDLANREVVDLGCGPGRLAIGAALLGARKVTGVDKDEGALTVARRNAKVAEVEVQWLRSDIANLPALRADTILMNPPFGIQKKGAEKPFLRVAITRLRPGGGLYFFASPGSQMLIERYALTTKVKVEDRLRSIWPFPPMFRHHTQRMGKVMVDRWILRREQA